MTAITVIVHVIGMSGKLWLKTGTFKEPDEAARFVVTWWKQLLWPQGWSLTIDGYEYDARTSIDENEIHSHIVYCLDLHEAFYGE